MTPLKSIRKYCVGECMNGSRHEVRECPSPLCPLWPYRFGKNPSRAGVGNRKNSAANLPADAQLSARSSTRRIEPDPLPAEVVDAVSERLSDEQFIEVIAKRLKGGDGES